MIKQSLSILIIEDNPALAANIYDYLEACGHIPDAAPDAIVLDWMMPRMDGMTMLERLRNEMKSTIPVIVISAKDQLEHKLRGFMTGLTTTSSSRSRWRSWKSGCGC